MPFVPTIHFTTLLLFCFSTGKESCFIEYKRIGILDSLDMQPNRNDFVEWYLMTAVSLAHVSADVIISPKISWH